MADTETISRPRSAANAGDKFDDDDDLEKLLKSGHGLDSLIPKDLSGKDKIVHADDALDFESEDELADEEDEPETSNPTNHEPADLEEDWTRDFANDIGLLGEPQDAQDAGDYTSTAELNEQAEEARRQFEEEERKLALDQLREWYPGFEPHIVLEMNKLFGPEPSTTQVPQPKLVRPMLMNRFKVDVLPDTGAEFVANEEELAVLHANNLKRPQSRKTTVVTKESIKKTEVELGRSTESSKTVQSSKKSEPRTGSAHMDVADWDYVLEIGNSDDDSKPKPITQFSDLNIVDDEIYDTEEEDAILENSKPKRRRMALDLNDKNLLFVEDRRMNSLVNYNQNATVSSPVNPMRRPDTFESKLNISNDRAYDMLKANYQRKVRSTIGSLSIDHTQVALRLQSPFYKVKLTKQQLRSWHRPKVMMKPGTQIQFSSLKPRKKRKDKSRTAQELFMRTSDMTLGDNAPFFLIEYSEEHPIILNSAGMGCKLINYYRKRNAEDKNRPKLPLGETHVLDVQDRSAFWNFGFVDPGKIVPTLYNQIIRAPVFQHQPQKTDFLLVKSTSTHRGTKFFIRPLPYTFVAGQIFPAMQIPGPHSRKVTTVGKNRLRMAVYRVLNRRTNQRLQVKDIASHFPDQSDMQIRQRLKEFMEYQRSGDDQGYWKMKPGEHLFNEEETRAMISPEDIVMIDSMQVGQQRLEDDTLYGQRSDLQVGPKPKETKDQDGLSLDEQLTPWNISKNFINAIQGKAMLQLHGVGDPTGRNEGFSLLRTSMKGGFVTEFSTEDEKKLGGHSYNVALQQKAYEEEIGRIWYAQQRALTTTDPRKLPDAEKPPVRDDNEDLSTSSRKVLQITRIVKDENDVLVRETELVTDPRVIRAYLKLRQAQTEAKLAIDKISVTDDVEANKQRRKFLEQELARLNRNADRRQARKATKQDAKLHATTRKCATCGAIGHIKTNKSCPMYNDIYLDASKAK